MSTTHVTPQVIKVRRELTRAGLVPDLQLVFHLDSTSGFCIVVDIFVLALAVCRQDKSKPDRVRDFVQLEKCDQISPPPQPFLSGDRDANSSANNTVHTLMETTCVPQARPEFSYHKCSFRFLWVCSR